MNKNDPRRPLIHSLVVYSRKTLKEWGYVSAKNKLTATHANNFLLGVMLDHSIKAEKAWEAAKWINDSLGDPNDVSALWENLASIDKRRLLGFLKYGNGGNAFHKYYKKFASQLPAAARVILDKYDGDPRRIWNGQKNIPHVRDRLEELPGIGIKLSRMAVLILARDKGLLGGKTAFPQLDIAPDIHVMRVFKRTGLIGPTDNRNVAIAVARELYPRFPGVLDSAAFSIGQTWCRPTNPKCQECPVVNDGCLKQKAV